MLKSIRHAQTTLECRWQAKLTNEKEKKLILVEINYVPIHTLFFNSKFDRSAQRSKPPIKVRMVIPR